MRGKCFLTNRWWIIRYLPKIGESFRALHLAKSFDFYIFFSFFFSPINFLWKNSPARSEFLRCDLNFSRSLHELTFRRRIFFKVVSTNSVYFMLIKRDQRDFFYCFQRLFFFLVAFNCFHYKVLLISRNRAKKYRENYCSSPLRHVGNLGFYVTAYYAVCFQLQFFEESSRSLCFDVPDTNADTNAIADNSFLRDDDCAIFRLPGKLFIYAILQLKK